MIQLSLYSQQEKLLRPIVKLETQEMICEIVQLYLYQIENTALIPNLLLQSLLYRKSSNRCAYRI
jgi:hypothetical protein